MRLKLLFLLFLSINLFANTLLDQYREYGIQKIQKQMDLELAKTSYWLEHLKDVDTKFGYIESYSSILSCDKSKSTLVLYKKDDNKTFSLKEDFSAYTGKMQGDKLKEGDLKTPLGVYNITKKITKLDSFYGPLAFVTSYPNMYDKYRGKNGSGIWIHGLPIEQERDEFTKGCIAINNTNIKELDKTIDIKDTLLIINQTELIQKATKEDLANVLSQLYKWRYAWIYNDIDLYLSFYADNFVRNDGMNLERFKKYKTRVFNKGEDKEIIFNKINVIPYPNTQNIFQVTFKEYYTSRSFKFIGDKILMVQLDENNNIKIFTEK